MTNLDYVLLGVAIAVLWAVFVWVLYSTFMDFSSPSEDSYTLEQQKASDYIQKITKGQVGSGDDPVGFIIASHAAISRERAAAMLVLKDVMNHDYLIERFKAALTKVIAEE